MKRTTKAVSVLLGYPGRELQAAVPEIRRALVQEGALRPADLARLEPLLARLERDDLYASQEAYSALFDSSGALSLHLFEHVHGESRERGQALVDLAERYAEHGLLLEGTELPDYLPLFLEFVSCLEPPLARDWLQQPVHVFAALAERLDQRGTPYAALLHALVALAGTRPQPQAVEAVRQRIAQEAARPLDEQWQEAPVTFSGAPAPQAGTGLGERLRAALRR